MKKLAVFFLTFSYSFFSCHATITIRPAEARDGLKIAQILYEATQDIEGSSFRGTIEEASKALAADTAAYKPLTFISWLVAVDDETHNVVGFIIGYPMPKDTEYFDTALEELSKTKPSSDKVAAFASAHLKTDEYFISLLAVARNGRGKGIGKKLMKTITENLHGTCRCTLHVLPKNTKAIDCYQHLGFRFTGNVTSDDEKEMTIAAADLAAA